MACRKHGMQKKRTGIVILQRRKPESAENTTRMSAPSLRWRDIPPQQGDMLALAPRFAAPDTESVPFVASRTYLSGKSLSDLYRPRLEPLGKQVTQSGGHQLWLSRK
jgi:hypothetical protein